MLKCSIEDNVRYCTTSTTNIICPYFMLAGTHLHAYTGLVSGYIACTLYLVLSCTLYLHPNLVLCTIVLSHRTASSILWGVTFLSNFLDKLNVSATYVYNMEEKNMLRQMSTLQYVE